MSWIILNAWDHFKSFEQKCTKWRMIDRLDLHLKWSWIVHENDIRAWKWYLRIFIDKWNHLWFERTWNVLTWSWKFLHRNGHIGWPLLIRVVNVICREGYMLWILYVMNVIWRECYTWYWNGCLDWPVLQLMLSIYGRTRPNHVHVNVGWIPYSWVEVRRAGRGPGHFTCHS